VIRKIKKKSFQSGLEFMMTRMIDKVIANCATEAVFSSAVEWSVVSVKVVGKKLVMQQSTYRFIGNLIMN